MIDGRIIDISKTLRGGTPVWPGDAPFRREQKMSREAGDPVNLSTLHMSPHTGTHADAPRHVNDGGVSIDALPLEPFIGAARVVTVTPGAGGLIEAAALTGFDRGEPPRILLRTGAGTASERFEEDFPALSIDAASRLVSTGVRLVGIDTPGVDPFGASDLEVHHLFAAAGVCWLENLDLSRAPDGIYTLVALPLKIAGGDGSPVRAVLINR